MPYAKPVPITKRTFVEDNELLEYVPVKDSLMKMKIGEMMIWPIKKSTSLSTTASRISVAHNRSYRLRKNPVANVVTIVRFR